VQSRKRTIRELEELIVEKNKYTQSVEEQRDRLYDENEALKLKLEGIVTFAVGVACDDFVIEKTVEGSITTYRTIDQRPVPDAT
jgi:hypothetical protein